MALAMIFYHRLKTRILVIPFSQLSIGPVSRTETVAFEEFETNLVNHHYTGVIGWVVSLQKALVLNSKQKIQNTREGYNYSTMKSETRQAGLWHCFSKLSIV